MATLRITDHEPGHALSFDLRELMDMLGEPAMHALWRSDVTALVSGENARNLYLAYETNTPLPGAVFYQLAAQTLQIIEGTFTATREGEGEPWVTLEAFDSTWWEVTTNDETVLRAIHERFQSVERIGDAGVP